MGVHKKISRGGGQKLPKKSVVLRAQPLGKMCLIYYIFRMFSAFFFEHISYSLPEKYALYTNFGGGKGTFFSNFSTQMLIHKSRGWQVPPLAPPPYGRPWGGVVETGSRGKNGRKETERSTEVGG